MIFEKSGLVCAFSRKRQNMSFVFGDTQEALKNRQEFLGELKIDYRDIVCAKQAHAAGIYYAQQSDKGSGALDYDSAIPDTDALVTDKKNLPLAVFSADCLSVFLFDPISGTIGIVHAGWKSSKERIVQKTVRFMQHKFATRPENLYAGLGPVIRSCCYKVGAELLDYFPDHLLKRGQDYYLDLAGANKQELISLGISQKKIYDPQICTSCNNKEFFSFRREGQACGRIMSLIMLK